MTIEPLGRLPVGMLVQQVVDSGDHGGRGLAEHPSRFGQGDMQRVGGPAVEAHLGGEVLSLEQSRVGDEQTRHSLALALGGMRIVP